MKKITLQIGGREMSFSESELIEILENHFASEEPNQEQNLLKNKYFEVNPKAINKKIFYEKRKDPKQEQTRQIILEAFDKVNEEPEKYGRQFRIMIPKKTWKDETSKELKEMASNLGDHIADWVEQALEWAQRISNGDTWESVCNKPDTEDWFRLIIWKDGYPWLAGGSVESDLNVPASQIHEIGFCSKFRTYYAVPLVVLY